MADNTIDSLQIEIVSNASKAQQALSNLSSSMKRAASVAGQFNSAGRGVATFTANLSALSHVNLGSTISQLRAIQSVDLSKLNKSVVIDVKVKGTDEVDRLPQAIQSAINNTKVDASKLTNQIAKAFHITGSAKKDIQSEVQDMVQSMANGSSVGKNISNLYDNIMKNGSVSRSDFDDYFGNAKSRYQEFLDYVNAHQFRVSKDAYGSDWGDKVQQSGMFKYFTKTNQSATELDSQFQELSQRFADIWTADDAGARTEEDQIDTIIRKIQEARNAVNAKPISLFGKSDQNTISGSVTDSLLSSADEMQKKVDQAKSSALTASQGKLPIDISVDEARIETQIQSAITQATSKAYNVKALNLTLDTKGLTQTLSSIFSNIDTSKIPQITDSFSSLAQSVGVLNTANFNDTGIVSLTNALKRLSEADMSKFDTGVLQNIVNTVSQLSNVGNVSAGINRLVSSLARLAQAGSNTSDTAKALPALGSALEGVIKTMQNASSLPQTINEFVSSLSKLASAGSKAQTTADNLEKLGDAMVSLITKLNGAPEVSDKILKLTSALGQLSSAGAKTSSAANGLLSGNSIGNSGGRWQALTQIANGVSSGFNTVLGKTVSIAKSAKSAISGFFDSLRIGSGSMNSIGAGIKTMIGSMLGFQGIVKAFNFGKQAMEWGSDITELENVVDVAFGGLDKGLSDLSGAVYKFAEDSQEQFGISGIAARRYAGTLMSMFNSSGFDKSDEMHKAAAQMSIDLTKLSGDLASFYNMSTTDEAFQKVQSGMAGMTRPLRDLGINMSVANLEAYALSQGITTSYQDMDQASQQLLRYNYLMSVSSAQQGDFARTSGTYANQVRLLQLNIQSLASTIGQGLISAITPAIRALNLLMSYLIAAANAFRTFMYTLFGKVAPATKGISSGLGSAADAADNLSSGAGGAGDGLGKAAGNAKKLKKELSLLPFDELNQLAKPQDSSNAGGGGGGGGGGGLGDLGDFDWDIDDLTDGDRIPNAINKWADQIKKAFLKHDWYGIGRSIADMLNTGLAKLYGVLNDPKLIRAIDHFTSRVAQAINGFVDNFDWELLGKVVGSAINRLVELFNGLAERIDFRDIGSGIARGINGLLDEVDWVALGNAIGNGIMIPWRMANGFVHDLHWDDLGRELGNLVNGVNQKIDWGLVADTLATGINGAFEALKNFTRTVNWQAIADNIVNGINTFLHETKWKQNAQTLNEFILDLLDTLVDIAKRTDWEALGEAIGDTLQSINWGKILKDVATIIWKVFSGVIKGMYKTPAGAIAATLTLAVAAVKTISGIDKLLVPFVQFFNGGQVTGVLGPVIKKAFEKVFKSAGAEGAAEGMAGALKTAESSMSGLSIGTGGLIAGIGALTTAILVITPKIAAWVDEMQGGNGVITTVNAGMDDFIAKLPVSSAQAQALKDVIEDCETQGMSADQTAQALIGKLDTMGISSDTARTALDALRAQGSTTKDVTDALATSIDTMSTTTADAAANIASAVVNPKVAFDDWFSAVNQLQAKIQGFTADDATALSGALTQIFSDGQMTDAEFQTLCDTFTELTGQPASAMIEAFNQSIPGAIQTTITKTQEADSAIGAMANSNNWGTVYQNIDNLVDKNEGLREEFQQNLYPALEESREHGQTVADSMDDIKEAVRTCTDNMSQDLDTWQNKVASYHDEIKTKLEGLADDWGTLDTSQAQTLGSLAENLAESTEQQSIALQNLKELNDSGLDDAVVQAILRQVDPSSQAMTDLLQHMQANDSEWQSFHEGIKKNLDLEEDIGEMADKMTTTFAEKTKPAFVQIGKDFKTNGGQISGFMMEGVAEGVVDNIDQAKTAMDNLADGMIEQINSDLGIHSPSTVMKEKGSFAVQGFALGLQDSSARAKINSAVKSISDSITKAFDKVDLTKTGRNFMQSFAKGISSSSKQATDAVNTVTKTIESTVSKVKLSDEGKAIIQTLANGIKSTQSTVTSAVKAIIQAIQSYLKSVNFTAQGKNFGTTLGNGIKSTQATVTNNMKSIVTAIQNYLKGVNLTSQGKTVGTTFAKGIESSQSASTSAVQKVSAAVKSAVQKMNFTNEAKVAGQTISKGISDGATSYNFGTMTSSLKSKLTSVANALKALGNNGGVFYNAGKSVGKGFLSGVSAGVSSKTFKTQVDRINGHYNRYLKSTVYDYRVSLVQAAKGGLFEGSKYGQYVNLAENGRDEAVIPLESKEAMSRIANSIVQAGGLSADNYGGSILDSEVVQDAVERGVSEALSNGSINVTVYSTLQTDDETIARSASRGQQKLDYRYKPVG